MNLGDRVRTCQICVNPLPGQPHACPNDGRGFIDHGKSNFCPRGKFDGAVAIMPTPLRIAVPPKPFDGSLLWKEWHRRALAYSGDFENEWKWLNALSSRVPCGVCKVGLIFILADLSAHPQIFASADSYFAWTVVHAHNIVNRKLGRREWAVEEAKAIYLKK